MVAGENVNGSFPLLSSIGRACEPPKETKSRFPDCRLEKVWTFTRAIVISVAGVPHLMPMIGQSVDYVSNSSSTTIDAVKTLVVDYRDVQTCRANDGIVGLRVPRSAS